MLKNQKKVKLILKKQTIALFPLQGWGDIIVPTTVPTGTGPTSNFATCNYRQKLQVG
jgi:hypothetical protein